MMNDKDKTVRHFVFQKEATYIEKQIITVQSGGNFYNGSQSTPEEEGTTNNEIIMKLMPVCMDNEDYAKEFLEAVLDKNGLEITEAVKRFRQQKKIEAQLCHHTLWQILYDNNIYKLTERNWNARIGY